MARSVDSLESTLKQIFDASRRADINNDTKRYAQNRLPQPVTVAVDALLGNLSGDPPVLLGKDDTAELLYNNEWYPGVIADIVDDPASGLTGFNVRFDCEPKKVYFLYKSEVRPPSQGRETLL